MKAPTRAHERSALRRVIAGVVLLVSLAACDVGHSIVADNTTDTQVLARLSGVTNGPTQPFSYVVVVPARTKLVIALQPFTGDHITTSRY